MHKDIYAGRYDAYGAALYDYYKYKNGFVIIERSDGFMDHDRASHYFDEFKKWPDIERKAVKHAKGVVLDVGAGAGRVSLYLQNTRKLKAYALDNSPLALKVCKQRGIKKAIQSPIRSYRPPFKYDTIIMYGNNFGLMQNGKTAVEILNNMYAYTSADAKIILETTDVYDTKAKEHLDYQRQNRRANRMSGQIRFRIRYKIYSSPWYDYLMVSKNELQNIVNKTDWYIEIFYMSKGPVYIAVLSKAKRTLLPVK